MTRPDAPLPGLAGSEPAFVARLGAGGDRPAIVASDDRVISYRELDERVEAVVREIGCARRLVSLTPVGTVDAVVAYLGALRSGAAVLLAPPAARTGLVERYRPALTWTPESGFRVDDGAPTVDLHPDLCVLLPTSGSSGSPRVVRLSRANLEANAASIVGALGIRPEDRAALVLPLTYCYGLSVLHSHLQAHASILLGMRTVTEDADWARFTRHRATSLAGVPHTFDLLDRSGFRDRYLPTLRLLTQAGGRMPPEQVARFARLGAEHGFGLAVMYGQTEATARMAVLPTDEVLAHPGTIGRAVAGGRFGLAPLTGPGDDLRDLPPDDAVPEGEVGELCYRGPNVMMGYAVEPRDLARGADVAVLRTGDLARRDAGGRYTIVGRRSRFVKPFGIRIDLDGLEESLAGAGYPAWCDGDDAGLRLLTRPRHADAVRADVVRRTGLPAGRISVAHADPLPRLPNGKPDRSLLRAPGAAAADGDLAVALAAVLGLPRVDDDDSFVGLGGDSLSYVEACGVLERRIRRVPRDWPQRTIGELRSLAAADPPRRWFTSVETGVVLRAVAIFFIVANHASWIRLQGGAHLLLVVAGYNYARLTLAGSTRDPVRRHLTLLARIGIPVLVAALLVATRLRLPDDGVRMLLSQYVQPRPWRFWFGEALVHILIVCTLLAASARFRVFERRRPFAVATGITVASLLLAGGVALVRGRPPVPLGFEYRTEYVAWFFALGWMLARAAGPGARVTVSVLAITVVPQFFDQRSRGVFVTLGVLALAWLATVPLPRILAPAVTVIAAASLAIYLVHYEDLYPGTDSWAPWVVTFAGIAFGVAVYAAVRAGDATVRRIRTGGRRRVAVSA